MRARCIPLLLISLAVPRAALAAEAKPLCGVDVTPREGLPSKGLFLVSFEDGVYRVCTEASGSSRSVISIREADIKSITFHPLRKRRPGSRARPPSDRQAGERGPVFFREMMHRQVQKRRKLEDLRRRGELGGYIAERREQLASAGSVEEATRSLLELAQAGRMNGTPLGREDWVRLIGSIRDPEVRERAIAGQKRLIQFLSQPRRGRRPGSPPRRPRDRRPGR